MRSPEASATILRRSDARTPFWLSAAGAHEHGEAADGQRHVGVLRQPRRAGPRSRPRVDQGDGPDRPRAGVEHRLLVGRDRPRRHPRQPGRGGRRLHRAHDAGVVRGARLGPYRRARRDPARRARDRGRPAAPGPLPAPVPAPDEHAQGVRRPDRRQAARLMATGQSVRILDGNTFVVSDERGDIEPSTTDPTGLFSYDTRFLSRWVLTVNDLRLNALSTDDLQYFEARFFLVPATGTVYIDPKLSAIRERAVGDGFHETLTLLSHSDEDADVTVRVEAASDFADLFEIKDALAKVGTYDTRIEDGQLILGYRRETFRRETTISASEPADADEHGLTFRIRLPSHGSWTTDLRVVTSVAGFGRRMARPKYSR